MKPFFRKTAGAWGHTAALSILAGYHLLLCFLEWFMLAAGKAVPAAGWEAGILWSLFVLAIILTASTALGTWHRINRPPAGGHHRAGKQYLFISVAVFIGCLYGHKIGMKTHLITIVHTANLLVFASLLGTLLVQAVTRLPDIFVVCVGFSLADIFSVLKGPSNELVRTLADYYQNGMEGTMPWVDWLLIKIPLPGTDFFHPVFGVSDWIAVSLLSASAVKLNLRDNLLGSDTDRGILYLPVSAAGLSAALGAASLWNRVIPALPLICLLQSLFLLIFYPESRKLDRMDVVLISAMVILFTIVFIGASAISP